ncbi:protein rep [Flavobacterium sp. XGLA_31]|uniref:protein rep n=1 Tax=Flavobacterium sp. XGLA_31 TaxID=3447666 RepID=UPI003F40F9C0
MAKIFDNQHFNTLKYKQAQRLDNDTYSVCGKRIIVQQKQGSKIDKTLKHSKGLSEVYRTLYFKMRNVAKGNYTLQETREKRKPRIQFCGYSVHSNDNSPITLKKTVDNSFYFEGVASCGSFWRCPVCAVKIAEQRKKVIETLVQSHFNSGAKLGFITLTVRHKRTQRLTENLDKILGNYRAFQNTKFFQNMRANSGYIGQVKTLEVTFTKQGGWHPHLHLLYFYDKNSDVKEIEAMQKRLLSKWAKYQTKQYGKNNALVKSQNQQIVDTQKKIAGYMVKYDIASEMTSFTSKTSKSYDGLTPFTALGKLAVNDYKDVNEKHLLKGIYSEFVETMQGKHYISVSNSLKLMYSNELKDLQKTDEEIVNEQQKDSTPELRISLNVWRKVSKNDLQPLIINKFAQFGLDGVYNLLTYFKDFQNIDIIYDKYDVPIIV